MRKHPVRLFAFLTLCLTGLAILLTTCCDRDDLLKLAGNNRAGLMRSNTPLRQESIAWHCADLLREGRYSDVIQLLQPGVVGAETRQSLTAIHDILTERWATLLWHKLMGTAVLDPHVSVPPDFYVYAQCTEGHAGGVTLLVINADRQRSFDLNLPTVSERYTLTARKLEDTTVELNGKPLRLTSSGDLPQFKGEPAKAGRMTFAPTCINYLTIEKAGNANCK